MRCSHPLVKSRDRRLGAQQKTLPRRCEPQCATAFGKPEAQLILQCCDMLAQHGLGDVQLLSRMTEIKVLAEHYVFAQDVELHRTLPV